MTHLNATALKIILLSAAPYAASLAAAGTLVDLSAEATRSTPNDLARAVVFAEATGPQTAEINRRINGLISDGLQTARKFSTLKVRTGDHHTSPVYGKNGRIDAWRIRSELIIESRDLSAVSEAMGRLQATLGIEQLALVPAPESRRQAEDAAVVDAIGAFQARAKLVADALGKPYKVQKMSVHTQQRPVVPVMRAAMMAEAAPMPLEAGDASITVTVSGQIELQD